MTTDAVNPSPSLDKLESRLRQGGYTIERSTVVGIDVDDDTYTEAILRIDWPSGKGMRRVVVDESDAVLLEQVSVDDYRVLGDYDAVWNTKSGVIEARLGPLARIGAGVRRRQLSSLPGVELLSVAAVAETGEEDDALTDPEQPWRLVVSSGKVTIEISPVSGDLKAMLAINWGQFESMKITGLEVRDGDGALGALEEVGRSFLLDLDLRYGAGYNLFERRTPVRRAGVTRITEPPTFPRNRYAPEPLALYSYGRSASGLPLLEYLAYYQAIEFYFPMIAQEETVRSVGSALRNPRFDITSEAALRRLISLATPNGPRGRMSERDQLRLTVRSVTDAETIRQLIESNEQVTSHLCAKAQTIQGVDRLQLNHTQMDLRDQVADRIYAIRCRIVHTKDDGGDSGVDLLLPSSREARSLGPDVDLVRLVAEQALISRATPLNV
jgi:hypothetical protein